MNYSFGKRHQLLLQRIAHRVMIEKGMLTDFPLEVLAEVDNLRVSALRSYKFTHDFRSLPWCSIDNDDSLDLDQMTAAEILVKDYSHSTAPNRRYPDLITARLLRAAKI